MPKQLYRRKPVSMDVLQWTGTNIDEVTEFLKAPHSVDEEEKAIYIETFEGRMRADRMDYIVRGGEGEYWAVKPWIFHKTYEPSLESDDYTVELYDKDAVFISSHQFGDIDEVNGFLKNMKDLTEKHEDYRGNFYRVIRSHSVSVGVIEEAVPPEVREQTSDGDVLIRTEEGHHFVLHKGERLPKMLDPEEWVRLKQG